MNVQVGDIIKLENNQFVTVSVKLEDSREAWVSRKRRSYQSKAVISDKVPRPYLPSYL